MSWSPEDDLDEHGRTPREAARDRACKCHGDMPGTCPGPANCPMEQGDDRDEDEGDGLDD